MFTPRKKERKSKKRRSRRKKYDENIPEEINIQESRVDESRKTIKLSSTRKKAYDRHGKSIKYEDNVHQI